MPVTRLDGTNKGNDVSILSESIGGVANGISGIMLDDQGFSTGKLFFEAIAVGAAGNPIVVGVGDANLDPTTINFIGEDANGWGFRENGSLRNGAGDVAYGSAWTEGDVISVAFDVDNGNIWFAVNGTWQNGATDGEIAAGTTTNAAFAGISGTSPFNLGGSRNGVLGSGGYAGLVFNFGQFGTSAISIPSGYAFPDSTESHPVISSSNAFNRFDWVDGGISDGTAAFVPHPGAHVRSDGKTVSAYGNELQSASTGYVARTGADLGSTKYYFEFEITARTSATSQTNVGFGEDSVVNSNEDLIAVGEGGCVDVETGTIFESSSADTGFDTGGEVVATDVIQFAVDVANGLFWVGLNGTYVNSGDPGAGTNETGSFTDPGDLRAMVRITPFDANTAPSPGDEDVVILKSESADWDFTAPSGFGEMPLPPSPKEADGAIDMAMSITATGDDPNQFGDGAIDMAMSITATGDDPNQFGDGALGLAILVSSQGINVNKHGDGALSLKISIASTGLNPAHHAAANVDLAISIAATGISNANFIDGTLTLPALNANGTIIRGLVISGSPRLPKLTSNGAGVASEGIRGQNVLLPKLQTNGEAVGPNSVTLPQLEVNGAILRGGKLTGTHKLPVVQITGTVDNPVVITGDATLPQLRTNGTLKPGTAISGNIVLPKLKTKGTIQPNNLVSGSITLPMLDVFVETDEALYPGAAGSIGFGLVILPQLQSGGVIENAEALSYTAWTMNTETFQTGNYDNYDFLSLVSYNERPYGVTSSGIFLLEGDDDDGTDIDAEFLTGIEDFSVENIKMLDRVYTALSRGSSIVLRVFVDGQTRVREYDLTRDANTTGARHAIFKGAKGLRSRSWQIGIKNQGGGDFLIDKLSYLFRRLRRKTRKY